MGNLNPRLTVASAPIDEQTHGRQGRNQARHRTRPPARSASTPASVSSRPLSGGRFTPGRLGAGFNPKFPSFRLIEYSHQAIWVIYQAVTAHLAERNDSRLTIGKVEAHCP